MKMKKLTLILFLLLTGMLYGQEKLIKLKKGKTVIQISDYYIAKVIDERESQGYIGQAWVGAFNKRVNLNLANGVEASIFDYLDKAPSDASKQVPIVIKILNLKVDEERANSAEIGTAKVKMAFYNSSNDTLRKLHEAEAFIEERGWDVTQTHERRIRKVIDACLKDW